MTSNRKEGEYFGTDRIYVFSDLRVYPEGYAFEVD